MSTTIQNSVPSSFHSGFCSPNTKAPIISAVAGGLENAVYNAAEIGCSSFALFLRNQRTWNTKPLDDHTVERFKAAVKVNLLPFIDKSCQNVAYQSI